MSPERVLSERKAKVNPCRWTENREDAGTNSAESGERNLEAESIRSRAESTGGYVMLKTAIEIRRSSARVYVNSLLDWEPAEKLKQRCDVVIYTFFRIYIYRGRHTHTVGKVNVCLVLFLLLLSTQLWNLLFSNRHPSVTYYNFTLSFIIVYIVFFGGFTPTPTFIYNNK